jgi:pimeloyl-ACP methyl ester carboxylesterase
MPVTRKPQVRNLPVQVPRARRSYFECRYGQLHVHHVMPANGGFDEAAPLLCLAGAAGTGRFFLPRLAALGTERSVYAPDPPGCGESDAAGAGAGPAEYAAAIGDFLDSMRLRRVDVLAHGEGVAAAAALIAARPDTVGRVVVSGAEPTGIGGRPLVRIDLPAQGGPLEAQLADLKGFLGFT